ncbi:MAG: hypothetical protein HZC55_11880 [Verrucomicrobia bacterium]|nr:hypothetical protein [Verrucomicrobiota bacterium]
MKTLLRLSLAAGMICGAASLAQARIERVVEKQFPVAGPGALFAETSGGSIRVTTTPDAVVRVKARQRIRADSEAEADELLRKLELVIEQQGADIRAVAKYERRPSGFSFGSWPPVEVSFEVSVPATFATDLRTSGGSITVGDLQGKARARTSGGSISLGKMGGPVEAHTSGGSISLGAAAGAVVLKTSGGSITAGQIAGPADLSTSGGSIKVESAQAPLRAHTSGGSVRAGLRGPVTADCSLSTSGGGVRVTVDKTAAFRLDASASGGHVDADGLTLKLEKSGRGRDRLAGEVNGGGPVLKLRSSGGGVSIRAE